MDTIGLYIGLHFFKSPGGKISFGKMNLESLEEVWKVGAKYI
jgi:hypothetical protein